MKKNAIKTRSNTSVKPNADVKEVETLGEAVNKADCKIVFGLQPNQIELIEDYSKRYGGLNHHVFRDVAKIVSWEPLTLACYYMEWQSTQSETMINDLKALVEERNVKIKKLMDAAMAVILASKPEQDGFTILPNRLIKGLADAVKGDKEQYEHA